MKSYSRFRLRVGSSGGQSKNKKGRLEPNDPKQFDAFQQFQKVNREFSRWCDHVQGEMPEVLVDGLQIIFADSQGRVPVKTGELKRSGYVTNSRLSRVKAYAEIGYARGGVPNYALVVHEDLMKYHEPPGQAKYLEDAINENFEDMKLFYEMAIKDMSGL